MRALGLMLLLFAGAARADTRTPLDDGKSSGGEARPVDHAAEIRRLAPHFRDCFNRSLKRDPALVSRGSIEIEIDENGRGEVRFSEEARGELASFQQCLRRVVKEHRFLPGSAVAVRYGFNIDPP